MAILRCLLFISCILFANAAYGQHDAIYRLVFSDTSNFELTTFFDHKRPGRYVFLDTTATWRAKRFWLDELSDNSPAVRKRLKRDEHHPYNYTYLFKDTTLDQLIGDNEKKLLSQKARTLTSKKIALRGRNYLTVPATGNHKGFYFIVTDPIVTRDFRYIFVDMEVYYKDKRQKDIYQYPFGTICVVYEKQPDGTLKKIKMIDHLIL